MAEDNLQDDTFFDDSGVDQDRQDKLLRKAALKKNLRIGGRNFLILAIVIGGGFAYVFTSGNNAKDSAGNGRDTANVVSRGGQGQVTEQELSEDSPIVQRQNEAKEQQVRTAEAKGSTYIERITFENESAMDSKKTEDATNPTKDTGDLILESVATSSPPIKRVVPVTNPISASPGQSQQAKPAGWELKDEVEAAKEAAKQVREDLKRVAQKQSDYGTYGEFTPVFSGGESGDGGSMGNGSNEIPFVTGGYGESLVFDQNPSGESPSTFKIPPDTRLFGLATVGHNSDVGGPMSFESVTPPLDGAVFISEDAPVNGEAITPRVTTMIYRGESYAVRALIVNPDTFQPGIASDVDNHYLSRWVPYLAAVFGGAYAETLVNRTTTTTPEGSTVNESSGVPDAGEQLQYTVGTGLGRAVPLLQEQINRPLTVTVDEGEEVGIWILSELEVKR